MHSQCLLGVGWIIFILFMLLGSVSQVLYLCVLIGLNQWLWLKHLVLVLRGVHFLGLPCGFGGAENLDIMPLFHAIICLELSPWKACILHLKEEKGVMLFVHNEKTVYIPLTILIVCSTSTMSIGRHVHREPNIKFQMGLISLAIFWNNKFLILFKQYPSPVFPELM